MGASKLMRSIAFVASLSLTTIMLVHRPVHFDITRELDQMLMMPQTNSGAKNSRTSDLHATLHSPFQLLVLSPQTGFVVGIVSPAYRKIPMFLYLNIKNNFLLRHKNETYPNSYTSSRSHAEILYCWFDVGIQTWRKWKDEPPSSLVVKDPLQLGEEYNVLLLVDPALQEGSSHAISATTIVRKTMRFYNGKDKVPDSMYNAEVKPKWNDAETVRRLSYWMKHYKSIGVEHFYIIDNEVDTSKPNLREIEKLPNVTYIRLPNVQFDGYRLEDNLKGLRYGFPGQVVMENAVLRMACTEWLVYTDLDELIVPAMYNHSLPNLIRYFQDKNCNYQGKNVVKCQSHDSTMNGIFELKFFNVLIDSQDQLGEVQYAAGKVMVRPNATEAMLVHFGRAFQSAGRRYGRVDVPTKHGYMAHYHALSNFSEALLDGADEHAKEMTIDMLQV